MNVPIILATDVMSETSPVTIGLAIGLAVVGIAWGEARVHLSGLREWKHGAEEREKARDGRITALEVRESRTAERLDYLTTKIDRIEAKLDRVLERREL